MRGLIVGKFNPPHLGHCYLIEQALRKISTLDVIICDSLTQDISGDLRKKWLHNLFPTVQFHLLSTDTFDTSDPHAWQGACLALLPMSPAIYFTADVATSKQYAELLGAKPQVIDSGRTVVPISATQIRECPHSFLQYLPKEVRDYYLATSE